MLLATTREKPRSRGQRLDVDGVAGARNRAGSERQRVGFRRGGRQPIVIAPERRDVREEKMRDEHRLRRPEMRERRHQRVAGGSTPGATSAAIDARERPLQQRDAAAQVQTQIDRHLLVARSAGVQTSPGVAEPLDQHAARRSCGRLRPDRRRTRDRERPR